MPVRSVFFEDLILNGRMLIECEASPDSGTPEQISAPNPQVVPPPVTETDHQKQIVIETLTAEGLGKCHRFPLAPTGETFLPFTKNSEMKQHIDDSGDTLQVLFLLIPAQDQQFDLVMVKQSGGNDPISGLALEDTNTVSFEQRESATTSSRLLLNIKGIKSKPDYADALGQSGKAVYVLVKQGDHHVMLENRDLIGFGTPGSDRIKLCNSLKGNNSARASFLRIWYSC